jgi:hypothetical protein
LYFWDAGFHGLGLLEYSPKRALECMNTYLTDLENTDHAFIMHGTPLPVMIYLYWQIYQKTGRRDVLEFFYPKLKRMYDFLAGKSDHSTTDKFKNGLLTSFDYFYNSGGWDDYPPQAWVHAAGLADDFATAVFPSHIIRSAKILQRRPTCWRMTMIFRHSGKIFNTLRKRCRNGAGTNRPVIFPTCKIVTRNRFFLISQSISIWAWTERRQ